jgi:putative FmdB family regulatory protein
MPHYEYICECGLVIELERPVKERDLETACPKCNDLTRRLPSRTSFMLKGNGWAKDGYNAN